MAEKQPKWDKMLIEVVTNGWIVSQRNHEGYVDPQTTRVARTSRELCDVILDVTAIPIEPDLAGMPEPGTYSSFGVRHNKPSRPDE